MKNLTFEKAAQEMPVIGILRDIPVGEEATCAKIAYEAGLKLIEVTMNTENAEQIIAALKKECEAYSILVGAGTVRTSEDLEKAKNAGASFIVSPTTIPEIIKKGIAQNLKMIPGALTPTEIELAYQSGATCVKVFPVSVLGKEKYIKELRGPFKDIPLLACGGVNAENAKSFLDAGANMLAFGGSIFNKTLMQEKRWDEISVRLKALLSEVKKAK